MDNNAWKQTLGLGLLATLAGAASCSNPAKVSPEASAKPALVPPQRASFVQGSQSFAGLSSEKVREAAMHYPEAALAAPEAPISLTADDGTGLVLESLDAQAVIEGPLAFTELRLRFRNPQARVLEGRFQLTLAEGASVSRLAMRMRDGWREAEVVERMAARRAYEDFLHRKQDPMLLEKEAGNQFRARIFPIAANGTKEVIVSFSQELRQDGTYTLPLRGLPAIDALHVEALVAEPKDKSEGTRYERHQMDAKGTVPTEDFQVATNSQLRALRHGSSVVARVRPDLSVADHRPAGITILFDTSASRAPGFSRQVKRLGSLVGALASAQGHRLPITLAAFDQEVTPVYSGSAGELGAAELSALLSRRPLGASDLSGALAWAGQQDGADRILVIGDGVITAGDEDIASQAKLLPAAIQRIDALLVGGIRDREAAERLVRGTRARDGVILRDELSDEEIARRLGAATASVDVSVQGASWVWPTHVDGVQPGDEIVVYAGFGEGHDASRELRVSLGGASAVKAMKTVAVPGPLLERSVVQAHIDRLQGAYVEELAADKKSALKAEIVDLSTKHRVLSDHTALLVLESESDYARFGIDRTALSDVLTVGRAGLELQQRNVLVMVAAEGPRAPGRQGRDKKSDKKKRKGEKASGRKDQEKFFADNSARENDYRASGGDGDEPVASVDGRPSPSPPSPAPMGRADTLARVPQAPPPAQRNTVSADSEPVMAEASDVAEESVRAGSRREGEATADAVRIAAQDGPPALTGEMATINAHVQAGRSAEAIAAALRWRNEESGNVMALVALGEALEAAGKLPLAARAYGSIIDLFPSRADLRRFAAARLSRLEDAGRVLSIDSLQRAALQRPDHLSVHRLLAYAQVRAKDPAAAFAAVEAGLQRDYPTSRFAGGRRILLEDMGIIAAVWLAMDPSQKQMIEARLRKSGAKLATEASTRFVLNWETDANDVDFHIYDGKGGHAYYSDKELPSGGALFADVTTGYGPECFSIPGKPQAFPYQLQIHYYSRGPMGYGMGQVEILQHDGKGGVSLQARPFVVMNDGAYLDLGTVDGPLVSDS